MGFFGKAKFRLQPLSTTLSHLKAWKPVGCRTEKQYEKSLYEHLQATLGDIQITAQYGRGRTRVDLMLDGRVVVELKNNLDSTGKYQRLIGQITDYLKWDTYIVIVLLGKTDQNLRRQLSDHLKQEDLIDKDFGKGEVTVIEK